MAGYGYTNRGGYTTYNGVAPQTDGWSKTSYTSDPVYQLVIIGAEGRRKPVISYAPNSNSESYVVETEIVESVPFATGYKQSTPVRVEVTRDYSPEKWGKSSSPVRYHAGEKWNRPSSAVHEQPQRVEEFSTKVHTEASRPSKFAPNSYHVNTGYGHQGDLSNKEWQNPRDDTIRNEKYDNRYKSDGSLEPTMTTTDGARIKPSHRVSGEKANLSNPTSDFSTAEYCKEESYSYNPSTGIIPPPRYAIQPPSGPNRGTYYASGRSSGNLNLASRPMGYNTRIIDSNEAARKYGGTLVPRKNQW